MFSYIIMAVYTFLLCGLIIVALNELFGRWAEHADAQLQQQHDALCVCKACKPHKRSKRRLTTVELVSFVLVGIPVVVVVYTYVLSVPR